MDCRINCIKLKAIVKTLIVLNQTDVEPLTEGFDFIIGVDGGCKWCIENNICFDLAIGDFDSLEQHYFDQLDQHAKTIDQHSRDKDLTDLELAIKSARAHSSEHLTVLGVWGGRTDHSLANLFCLAGQSVNIPVSMPGHNQNGYLLKSQQSLELTQDIGQIVSIMAIQDDCHGVSNSGMRYPLTNSTISQGSGLGLSNETITNSSSITIVEGALLVLTHQQADAKIFKTKK